VLFLFLVVIWWKNKVYLLLIKIKKVGYGAQWNSGQVQRLVQALLINAKVVRQHNPSEKPKKVMNWGITIFALFFPFRPIEGLFMRLKFTLASNSKLAMWAREENINAIQDNDKSHKKFGSVPTKVLLKVSVSASAPVDRVNTRSPAKVN
jgi:hypothetical protein